jgi:hypothetical protein
VALVTTIGPYCAPYNRFIYRDWWRGCNLDTMLAQLGFTPGSPPLRIPRCPHYVALLPLVHHKSFHPV